MRKWLIEEREKKSMNQTELARESKLSQQLISKAERGDQISIRSAKKIADVLGCKWEKFYAEELDTNKF